MNMHFDNVHVYVIVSAKRDLTQISSTRNRNVNLASKCMADKKFRALHVQLNNRFSESQCVRSDAV